MHGSAAAAAAPIDDGLSHGTQRMITQDPAVLYSRYRPMVYRRVLRFFEPQEAEEVVQEVFVKIIEEIDSFRGEANPGTWIWRLATHHCINRLRNLQRRRELDALQGPGWTPAPPCSGPEVRALARNLCDRLPSDLVEVAFLHSVDGLSQQEIAQRLGLSRRAVGYRLDRLRALAAEMDGPEGES